MATCSNGGCCRAAERALALRKRSGVSRGGIRKCACMLMSAAHVGGMLQVILAARVLWQRWSLEQRRPAAMGGAAELQSVHM